MNHDKDMKWHLFSLSNEGEEGDDVGDSDGSEDQSSEEEDEDDFDFDSEGEEEEEEGEGKEELEEGMVESVAVKEKGEDKPAPVLVVDTNPPNNSDALVTPQSLATAPEKKEETRKRRQRKGKKGGRRGGKREGRKRAGSPRPQKVHSCDT